MIFLQMRYSSAGRFYFITLLLCVVLEVKQRKERRRGRTEPQQQPKRNVEIKRIPKVFYSAAVTLPAYCGGTRHETTFRVESRMLNEYQTHTLYTLCVIVTHRIKMKKKQNPLKYENYAFIQK